MSIILTERAYEDLRAIRRRHSPHHPVGPRWTVLGSDVLFAAFDLACVEPLDFLDRMSRSGDRAELGRKSPVFGQMLPQLPACTFIIVAGGVVKMRCDPWFTYTEEKGRAELYAYGKHLPETAIEASRGRRLSEFVDITSCPALALVDPIVKGARNKLQVRTGTNHHVVLDLEVGWRSFAPAPHGIELRKLVDQFGSCRS